MSMFPFRELVVSFVRVTCVISCFALDFLSKIPHSSKPSVGALLPMATANEEEPPTKKTQSESTPHHSRTSASVDRLSDLPEPIIHHILSLLPPKDATQTSSLSRKWKNTWDSFPILEFDQILFNSSLPENLRIFKRRDLFLKYLNSTIRNRREIQKLIIHAQVRSPRSDPRFDRAVKLALERDVRSLELDSPFPQNGFQDLPKCVYRAKRVTSLRLNGYRLGLRELIWGCPSIEELCLELCQGFEEVRVSSSKMKRLELDGCDGLKTIELDACNLQSFRYSGIVVNSGDLMGSILSSLYSAMPCDINLIGCKFLKSLSLKNASVSDQWFNILLSKLVHLESVSLEDCVELTSVRIRHERLKSLCLLGCGKLVEIEIDSPKLCLFKFKGKIAPFGLLNSSGALNATLALSRGNTVGWFVKLRRLLGLFDHCKSLKLVCNAYEDLIFPEEVKDSFVPPLHDLKHLKIECHSPPVLVDYTELMDNLLWLSPHVETLSLASYKLDDRMKLTCQFEYKKIPGKDEENSFCCGAHPKECWQHCLKKVILIDDSHGSVSHGDKKKLFEFFIGNAKALESIQDNKETFKTDGRKVL